LGEHGEDCLQGLEWVEWRGVSRRRRGAGLVIGLAEMLG
jgi:hypothetical protein